MRNEAAALRLGGALAVVGGLGYLLTLLVHGNLPDQTTEIALDHIAGRPEWRGLKLSLIVSVLCWVGAFTQLACSLKNGLSAALARWATAVAAIGVAVMVVEYAIIGHALAGVAKVWAGAPDPEAPLRLAQVLLAISSGLFHSFVAWLLGLPFVLLGTALVLERGYPRGMGWIAVVAGSGTLLAGVTRFLGIGLVPYPLLYGGLVLPLTLWLTALGVLMWRQARASAAALHSGARLPAATS